eukprot:366564-Prymnesium_polylepis.2
MPKARKPAPAPGPSRSVVVTAVRAVPPPPQVPSDDDFGHGRAGGSSYSMGNGSLDEELTNDLLLGGKDDFDEDEDHERWVDLLLGHDKQAKQPPPPPPPAAAPVEPTPVGRKRPHAQALDAGR